MKIGISTLIIIQSIYSQSKINPSDFWKDYSLEEKIAFINGAYGAIAKLKSQNQKEVIDEK